MKNKLFTKEVIGWLIVLILLFAAKIFLPKSGNLVLLDECFDVLIICFFCIYIIFKLVTIKSSILYQKKVIGILVIIGCLVIGTYFSKDIVLDVINGTTREIELNNIDLTKRQIRTSVSYHIKGTDNNGQVHTFEISNDDASKISRIYSGKIIIEYYQHTERVVALRYY